MSDYKYVSIIVPCHNESKYIEQCLTSLLGQNYPKNKYEVIVVDNGSTDDTLIIAKCFPVVCIELRSGNVGAVRNKGADIAKGKLLAFIDGDCIAPKNWLQEATSLLNDRTDLVVGGGANLSEDANWLEQNWLLENSRGSVLPKHLIGCSIVMPKTTFVSVNGFDEEVTSGEDTKLTEMLKEKKVEIQIVHSLSVTHLGNAKTPMQFINRQAWHAENYLYDFKSSLKDPVFYLTLIFITSIILSFLAAVMLSPISEIGGIFTISLPLVLSAKRIMRSGDIKKKIKQLPAIYILDLLYLVGRSVGLLRSLTKWSF